MHRAALWGAVILTQVISVSAEAGEPGWVAVSKSGCRVWGSGYEANDIILWDGNCTSGMANGSGTLEILRNGKVWEYDEGSWMFGKRNGHGVATWVTGERYEGDFRDGSRTGHGVYLWPDGVRYDGDFVDGKLNGHGVLTWASGSIYDGNFHNDQLTGHGVMRWPDGRSYEGEFLADLPNGYGVGTAADGTRYEGNWTMGCFKQGNRKAWFEKTKEQCGF
jgi:hypothetical protein